MTTASRSHLHRDDCPQALAALAAALWAKRNDPAALLEIGYEATESGAWVDWDRLLASWLSSTEKAAVVMAWGIARAERQGGWPPRLHEARIDALRAV